MGDKSDELRFDTRVRIPDELKDDILMGTLNLIFKKEPKWKIVFLGIAKYYELEATKKEDKKIMNEYKRKARKIVNSID